MRALAFWSLAVMMLPFGAAAQDAASPAADSVPVVLADHLERWVDGPYRAAALCRQTILLLLDTHRAIEAPERQANARALADALGATLDEAMVENYAKGLTFEDGMAIDSYIFATAEPATARFVATRNASELAIDLRTCPSALAALQKRLADG
jgi:hypothetical protein